MRGKAIIKNTQQIADITEAGKWHTELLELLKDASKPGVVLMELEAQASNFLKMHNLTGAFKGYNGFPANCCLSVNDCVVHGIPDETVLQEGDLLKIDVGVQHNTGISDAAISVVIGGKETNKKAEKLTQSTKNALDKGLETLGPGKSFYKYGKTIYNSMKNDGFSVIKNLTGHGVGSAVHEPPSIYNWPHKSLKKIVMEPGMVVALEPITAISSKDFVQGTKNDWNVYTANHDLGAQREYTVLITDEGYEVLAGVQKR